MPDTVQVPYLDFSFQHEPLRGDIEAALQGIIQSGHFVLGEEVSKFEQQFAAYCGVGHAIAVNSGTSALHLALLGAGVEAGDEVITTPATFVATVAAISYIGARPVLVDIDAASYCLDPTRIEAALTARTKAILPVHLYGAPAAMDAIVDIAQRHDLAIVEDAAQAHGARYGERRVGGFGRTAAFSFYPGKNLGAFGEGGAVTTDDADIAARLRLLRNWGEAVKGEHKFPAFNYRMDAFQGAVLGLKLAHLEEWNAERRRIAATYRQRLAATPLVFQTSEPDSEHVYHIMAVADDDRDALRAWLLARGIQCGVHYAAPVHLAPAYQSLGYEAGDFPHAEGLFARELSLPIYPGLSDSQIDLVINAIDAFFVAHGRG